MKTKIFNILSLIFFILLIIYLHLGTIFIAMNKISILTFSKGLHLLGIISLVMYICYKIIQKKKIIIYDIIIIFLVVCAIISTVFAINIDVALLGTHNRHEGLYSILSYYSFFLLATTTNTKNQKIVMNLLIFFGLFQIAIGTIQTLRITNILGYDRSNNWSARYTSASGTLINPSFYSTYILICTLYLLGCLKHPKIKIKLLYSILLSIYVYGLIIGNSISSMLIFILTSIIVILRNIKLTQIKKNIIPTIIIILLSITSLHIVDKSTNNKISGSLRYSAYDIINIFKYGIKDTTGNSRIYVWKETLKKVPENLFTGLGIDNYLYINDGRPIITVVRKQELAFDKAHNDYLQILITEGIFALIGYLVLIFVVLFATQKQEEHNYGLTLSFFGYILQMILIFSVIVVAPAFYMIMGFIISNKELKE